MSLLHKVRDAAADSSVSLSDALRQAKILASALRSEDLKNWADSELNGYSDRDSVPGYRVVDPPLLGNFAGMMGAQIKNQELPTYNLPENLKTLSGPVPLPFGVRELAELASSDIDAEQFPRISWPPEAVMLARKHVEMSGGLVLTEAYRPFTRASLHGVLDAVRNRLLDFTLELEEASSSSSTEDIAKLSPERLQNAINITILGDNNVVASGFGIDQTVTQIPVGDTTALHERLRALGVPQEDLRDLDDAMTEDAGSKPEGGVGKRVSAWLGNMTLKAAQGAWTAVSEKGAELLAKAITAYYGLPQ